MHTSRVSSPRHSASRVFFRLETASLHSSRTRLHSPTPPTYFPLGHRSLRHSTPLAATREWATLLDDTRLAPCSSRPLVCITESGPVGLGFFDRDPRTYRAHECERIRASARGAVRLTYYVPEYHQLLRKLKTKAEQNETASRSKSTLVQAAPPLAVPNRPP
jgi:molybdenum cofactor biosynthesis enzyme MoaA